MSDFLTAQFPVAVLEVVNGGGFLATVSHDSTLTGAGTPASPLGVTASSSAGAPTPRANGAGWSSSGAGNYFGPDIQTGDFAILSVLCDVGTLPTVPTGTQIGSGTTRLGGSSIWISYWTIAVNVLARPVPTVSGGNVVGMHCFPFVAGTRGSVSVDQATINVETVKIGQIIVGHAIQPTQKPSIVLWIPLINGGNAGGAVCLAMPGYGGGTAPSSPTLSNPTVFMPFGPGMYDGVTGYPGMFAAYSNDLLETPSMIFPQISATTSADNAVLVCNLY